MKSKPYNKIKPQRYDFEKNANQTITFGTHLTSAKNKLSNLQMANMLPIKSKANRTVRN